MLFSVLSRSEIRLPSFTVRFSQTKSPSSMKLELIRLPKRLNSSVTILSVEKLSRELFLVSDAELLMELKVTRRLLIVGLTPMKTWFTC